MRVPISMNIAGLYYHYKPSMPDRMTGYIKAEPDNPNDPNAIGIYTEEYGMVGYIPKNRTDFVRAWARTNRPFFTCDIRLHEDFESNNIFGSVFIFDNVGEIYYDNPYRNKIVFLCRNKFSTFGFYDTRKIVESFGADVITDNLSKDTEVVVYEEELPEYIKDKAGTEDYHFSILTIEEFIRQAIPVERRNSEIYGRVVTPAFSLNKAQEEYLQKFIILSGGIYKQSYSEAETEVAIVRSENIGLTVAKMRTDGKTIIKAEDLVPEIFSLTDDSRESGNVSYQSQTTSTTAPKSTVDTSWIDDDDDEKSSNGYLWKTVLVVVLLFLLLKACT